MSKTSALAFYDDTAQGWERALYAFLAQKQRRSGSRRTPEAYSRMIQDFLRESREAAGPRHTARHFA